ncbi:unnamed protein product, partial [Tilletia controversa]
DDFVKEVRGWNVPSPDQSRSDSQVEEADALEYEKNLPLRRRLAARWSVDGPKFLFTILVIALQSGFGIWQGVTFLQNFSLRKEFGWGIFVAKFTAGALYPTLFFMLISMSRWVTTFLRRSYIISRFINADFHQSFHVRMAIVGLLLATLHAIGHLTGDFLHASRPKQREAILATGEPARTYRDYINTLPGWSGLVSLGIFWTIALLSGPAVRRWNYEVFQLGHLLMFPMVGFLAAHGTAKLLQGPMLGYWLAIPTIIVILERLHRVLCSLRPIQARLEILDDDTVCVTAKHPRNKKWQYNAGQYILLQIPLLSRFQFHPFTISACVDDCIQVHIKTTSGDWTAALHRLALEKAIHGSISPWRRRRRFSVVKALRRTSQIAGQVTSKFHSRDSSIFSDDDTSKYTFIPSLPKARRRSQVRISYDQVTIASSDQTRVCTPQPEKVTTILDSSAQRRVDFIWLVREATQLLWFSDLLNRVTDFAELHRKQLEAAPFTTSHAASTANDLPVDLRINTFITAKPKSISAHVFRVLLDRHRSDVSPVSALTGLRTQSSFGRPDLEAIMTAFYEDVVSSEGFRGNIGVFFCGTPAIGRVLSDQCAQLTARALSDRVDVRFHFLMEVFG